MFDYFLNVLFIFCELYLYSNLLFNKAFNKPREDICYSDFISAKGCSPLKVFPKIPLTAIKINVTHNLMWLITFIKRWKQIQDRTLALN